MKITNKDKIFVIIALPVALIVCYYFVFLAPKSKELDIKKQTLLEIESVEELEMRSNLLEAKKHKNASELLKLKEDNYKDEAFSYSSSKRLSLLVSYIEKSGCRVDGVVCKKTSVDDTRLTRLIKDLYGRDVSSWEIVVLGGYVQVSSLLKELGSSDIGCVIEGVSMKDSALLGKNKVWTIKILI